MKNIALLALLLALPLYAGGNSQIISVSSPLTLTNGLISIAPADTTHSGYLSSTDWNTFNNKISGTPANLTSPTTGVTIGGGTNAVFGTGTTVSIQTANGSQPGLLSASDWTTFNAKQAAITPSNLTSPTSGVSITGGTGAVLGSGAAIAIQTATDSQPGLMDAAAHAQITANTSAISGKQGALPWTTSGDLVYYGSSGPARLAKGADGTALQMVSGLPSWVAAGSSVTGPGTTVSGNLVTWNSTTGAVVADSGVYSISSVMGFATSEANYSYFQGRNTQNITQTAAGSTYVAVTGLSAATGQTVGNNNTFVGDMGGAALRSTGFYNTVIGDGSAGALNGNANENTFVGSNVDGWGFNATGSFNVGLGFGALGGLTTGSHNIGIGWSTGNAANIRTGTYNISIGDYVEQTWGSSESHQLAIGGYSSGLGEGGITDGWFGRGIRQAPTDLGAGFTFHPTEIADGGATDGDASGVKFAVAGARGTGAGVGGSVVIQTAPPGSSGSNRNPLVDQLKVDGKGNVVTNATGSALSTSATDGFTYVPSSAGAPTGTPTAYTGAVPMVVDTTNKKLCFYFGGAWECSAALTP